MFTQYKFRYESPHGKKTYIFIEEGRTEYLLLSAENVNLFIKGLHEFRANVSDVYAAKLEVGYAKYYLEFKNRAIHIKEYLCSDGISVKTKHLAEFTEGLKKHTEELKKLLHTNGCLYTGY